LSVDVGKVVRRQFDNGNAGCESNEGRNPIIPGQDIFQEGPRKYRSETEEKTAGCRIGDPLLIRNLPQMLSGVNVGARPSDRVPQQKVCEIRGAEESKTSYK
jgi:hypothetical protein